MPRPTPAQLARSALRSNDRAIGAAAVDRATPPPAQTKMAPDQARPLDRGTHMRDADKLHRAMDQFVDDPARHTEVEAGIREWIQW